MVDNFNSNTAIMVGTDNAAHHHFVSLMCFILFSEITNATRSTTTRRSFNFINFHQQMLYITYVAVQL